MVFSAELLRGKFREMPATSDKKGAPTEICAPKNANPDCCETNVTDWGYKSLSTLHGGICIFTKFIHVRVDKKESMYSFRKKTYTPVIRLFRRFSIPQNALQVKREILISDKTILSGVLRSFFVSALFFSGVGENKENLTIIVDFSVNREKRGTLTHRLSVWRSQVDTFFREKVQAMCRFVYSKRSQKEGGRHPSCGMPSSFIDYGERTKVHTGHCSSGGRFPAFIPDGEMP